MPVSIVIVILVATGDTTGLPYTDGNVPNAPEGLADCVNTHHKAVVTFLEEKNEYSSESPKRHLLLGTAHPLSKV